MKNDRNIKRYVAAELRDKVANGDTGTDLARIAALTPDEIERAAAEQLEEDGVRPGWVTTVEVVPAGNKKALSLRLDPDLIDWFRATGPGYQTRINTILRAYMRDARTRGKNVQAAR